MPAILDRGLLSKPLQPCTFTWSQQNPPCDSFLFFKTPITQDFLICSYSGWVSFNKHTRVIFTFSIQLCAQLQASDFSFPFKVCFISVSEGETAREATGWCSWHRNGESGMLLSTLNCAPCNSLGLAAAKIYK